MTEPAVMAWPIISRAIPRGVLLHADWKQTERQAASRLAADPILRTLFTEGTPTYSPAPADNRNSRT